MANLKISEALIVPFEQTHATIKFTGVCHEGDNWKTLVCLRCDNTTSFSIGLASNVLSTRCNTCGGSTEVLDNITQK